VNITVFEKTGRIGGRALTVDAYDNPMEPIELGAAFFTTQNDILYGVSHRFGLPLQDPAADKAGDFGRAPQRLQSLVRTTMATLFKMYKPPYFPFRSLTTTSFMLQLTKITTLTGEQYLKANSVGLTPLVSTPVLLILKSD
jgi:prenylcysteine oxidase / farnesylcysteine lyase